MDKAWQVKQILPKEVVCYLESAKIDFSLLQEIRLRVNAPLFLLYQNREYYITKEGMVCLAERQIDLESTYIVTRQILKDTLAFVSHHSLYAYEDEIRQGFITIQGGHRVGITGKIMLDKQSVKGMKYISCMNIRVSHEIKGCADFVMPYLYQENHNNREVMQTLIISPPRCGKTTLLRDLVRQLSNAGKTVGVVDERSEIGACYMGVPENDVGVRTDILDCCPKVEGMMMLVRTMAPQVIAVDEIGSREDLEAMSYVINAGVKLIATVHGSSLHDLYTKPVLRQMVEDRLFERYIVLESQEKIGKVGVVAMILDGMGNKL